MAALAVYYPESIAQVNELAGSSAADGYSQLNCLYSTVQTSMLRFPLFQQYLCTQYPASPMCGTAMGTTKLMEQSAPVSSEPTRLQK